jgi:hypothetical protein
MLLLASLMGAMLVGATAIVGSVIMPGDDLDPDPAEESLPDDPPPPENTPDLLSLLEDEFDQGSDVAPPDGEIIGGGETPDQIIGGEGDDQILGRAGADAIDGAGGDDVIFGGAGVDHLDGGAGQDSLHGLSGDDALDGGSGDDTLFGHMGQDQIAGGAGNDQAHGGAGGDTLAGGAGADALHGGLGGDTLGGGSGEDTLFGASGEDWLLGILPKLAVDEDDDEPPTDKDYLNGGAGADTILSGEGDVVTAGSGEDVIAIDLTGLDVDAAPQAVEFVDFDGDEDQLILLIPGELADDPADDPVVEVMLDDAGGVRVMVDGALAATLPPGSEISASDIVLMSESTAAEWIGAV